VTTLERWSVVGLMTAVAVVFAAVAMLIGSWIGVGGWVHSTAWGFVVLGVHGLLSVLAGAAAGWAVGCGGGVGAHLGLYNMATPLALVARVRWLGRHRPGFLPGHGVAGGPFVFLAVCFCVYAAGVVAAAAVAWWAWPRWQ